MFTSCLHVSSVHEGKKPFKCNICDASYSGRTVLKLHIAAVHERKKPFKCDTCDAGFTLKQGWKDT